MHPFQWYEDFEDEPSLEERMDMLRPSDETLEEGLDTRLGGTMDEQRTEQKWKLALSFDAIAARTVICRATNCAMNSDVHTAIQCRKATATTGASIAGFIMSRCLVIARMPVF